MTRLRYTWIVFRAFCELVRYDVVHSMLRINHRVRAVGLSQGEGSLGVEHEAIVCDALVLACCLYWKPVLCLQRSVCVMRLLRSFGVGAHVVIGYRPVPFFSHAWVEVDGRVVNDSPVYQKRLIVLHTI